MRLKHKVLLIISGLLFCGYFGTYTYFRYTKKIVHFQSYHGGQSHKVKAVMPDGPHIFVASVLSEDCSLDDLMLHEYNRVNNLNTLFYPARKMEVFMWRMLD